MRNPSACYHNPLQSWNGLENSAHATTISVGHASIIGRRTKSIYVSSGAIHKVNATTKSCWIWTSHSMLYICKLRHASCNVVPAIGSKNSKNYVSKTNEYKAGTDWWLATKMLKMKIGIVESPSQLLSQRGADGWSRSATRILLSGRAGDAWHKTSSQSARTLLPAPSRASSHRHCPRDNLARAELQESLGLG